MDKDQRIRSAQVVLQGISATSRLIKKRGQVKRSLDIWRKSQSQTLVLISDFSHRAGRAIRLDASGPRDFWNMLKIIS